MLLSDVLRSTSKEKKKFSSVRAMAVGVVVLELFMQVGLCCSQMDGTAKCASK